MPRKVREDEAPPAAVEEVDVEIDVHSQTTVSSTATPTNAEWAAPPVAEEDVPRKQHMNGTANTTDTPANANGSATAALEAKIAILQGQLKDTLDSLNVARGNEMILHKKLGVARDEAAVNKQKLEAVLATSATPRPPVRIELCDRGTSPEAESVAVGEDDSGPEVSALQLESETQVEATSSAPPAEEEEQQQGDDEAPDIILVEEQPRSHSASPSKGKQQDRCDDSTVTTREKELVYLVRKLAAENKMLRRSCKILIDDRDAAVHSARHGLDRRSEDGEDGSP